MQLHSRLSIQINSNKFFNSTQLENFHSDELEVRLQSNQPRVSNPNKYEESFNLTESKTSYWNKSENLIHSGTSNSRIFTQMNLKYVCNPINPKFVIRINTNKVLIQLNPRSPIRINTKKVLDPSWFETFNRNESEESFQWDSIRDFSPSKSQKDFQYVNPRRHPIRMNPKRVMNLS